MKRKAIRFAAGKWWLYEVGENKGAPFYEWETAIRGLPIFPELAFDPLPEELR